VGALARFNNNYRFLPDRVKAAARKLNLQPVNYNPFMNNIAQVIECYHVMLEAIDILDKLLDNRLDRIRAGFRVKAGEGVGAVGAPRGILYHSYILNRKGVITKANCIIPTTQNNANIHHDMAALVQQSLKQNKNDMEITRLSEMLVRAYDPCISCSVH